MKGKAIESTGRGRGGGERERKRGKGINDRMAVLQVPGIRYVFFS